MGVGPAGAQRVPGRFGRGSGAACCCTCLACSLSPEGALMLPTSSTSAHPLRARSPPPITSNLASPALASQVDPARRLPAVHPDVGLLGASANPITRRAGGRLGGRAAPRRIVVDVREFMSSLPAVLHQQARRWALGGPGRGGSGRAAVAVHGGLAGVGRQSTVSELSSSSRVLIRCFRVGAGAHHM